MSAASPTERVSVLHVASGDGWGGAERVISVLVQGSVPRADLGVACLLFNEGRLADELRAVGAEVEIADESELGFFALVRRVRERLAGDATLVCHAHRYKEIAAILFASLPRRPRAVVTVHGLEPWGALSWRDRLQNWLSVGAAALLGARVVAVSPELEARLRRVLPGGRVLRIPNPLPPPNSGAPEPSLRDRLGWPPDCAVVGFVGRLEPVKGPDRLLEVAAATDRAVRFVLMGGGSLEASLRADIAARELADRVALLGEVDDAPALIAELDVLAVPSRHEGLPMVILEAASHDTRVVAFAVGGIPDVLDGSAGAQLVPDGDVRAFAACIEAALSDPASAEAAAAWGATIRDRMGIERVVSSYIDAYAQVAGR